jgi:phospholipid/cholesterol/gamma-HCH transport system substrate-binding protein
MDTQSSKFKVRLGLFVAGGFLLFIIAIFLIGRQKHLFDPIFNLTTSFHDISGLQVGNKVRFSGINVGTVESIILTNDTTVEVGMIVKKSIQQFIKSDCTASIGSEGIIGDKVLIISQGSSESPAVKDGEFLSSAEPVEIDAIISSLNVTAGNFELISGQLSEIMVKINHGKGTLGRLIQDSTISENINQTIINLRKSSKGLNENMEAAKSNFLLRGYYNKKEKQAEKARQDSIRLKEEKTKKKIR